MNDAKTKRDACPLAVNHEQVPEHYIERALWAEEKLKTHHQVRCEGCGLFAVWLEGAVPHGS